MRRIYRHSEKDEVDLSKHGMHGFHGKHVGPFSFTDGACLFQLWPRQWARYGLKIGVAYFFPSGFHGCEPLSILYLINRDDTIEAGCERAKFTVGP